jgi:hypothetical protein
VVVALLGSAAGAQQKYRLKEATERGDVSLLDKQVKVTVQFQVPVPGQEARDAIMSFGEREQYRQSILAIDPTGKPSHLRRVYAVARRSEVDPAGKKTEKVSSLQGKTVAIRIVGAKVVVTCAKGKLAAADVKSLQEEILSDPAAPPFFPDQEVGPGDEWEIDAEQLVTAFGKGIKEATAKARFEEVVNFSGHPCARLRLDLKVVAQPEGLPSPLTFQLVGDVYHATDLHRTLVATLSGPLEGSFKPGPDQPDISISGDAMFRWGERWQKVAGKPVVEKRVPAGAGAAK